MASYSAKVIQNFSYYLVGNNIQVDGDVEHGFIVFDLTNPYSKIRVPYPFYEYIDIKGPKLFIDTNENEASKSFFWNKRDKW